MQSKQPENILDRPTFPLAHSLEFMTPCVATATRSWQYNTKLPYHTVTSLVASIRHIVGSLVDAQDACLETTCVHSREVCASRVPVVSRGFDLSLQ